MPYYSKRRVPNNYQLSKRIDKLVKAPELKYHHVDVQYSPVQMIGNPVISLLTIQRGVNPTNRIGDKIMPTSIQFKALITNDPNSAGDSYAFARIIIFWDSEPDADGTVTLVSNSNSDPAVPALLDEYDFDTPTEILLPYMQATTGRFRVLYDKVFNIASQFSAEFDVAAEPPPVYQLLPTTARKFIKKKIKLSRAVNYLESYGGEDATPIPVSNNLFFGIITDQFDSGNPSLSCRFNFKLIFKDQ